MDQTSRIVAEQIDLELGIITQGPVNIVAKLYQFHIVTVVELCSVSYNSQFCPLTYRSQYSYFLLTFLSFLLAAISKRSRKPFMKVLEYLHPGLKIIPFNLTCTAD